MKSQLRLELEAELAELHEQLAELRRNRPCVQSLIKSSFADAWRGEGQEKPPVLASSPTGDMD